MKNLVKYTALAAAILGMASVTGAQAPVYTQNTKTTTLNATANVGADISVVGTSFTFGSVYRNNGPYTLAPTAATAGYFTITGTSGSAVTAPLSGPTDLTSASTTGLLPVTFSYSKVSAQTGVCTAAAFATSSSVTLSGTAATAGSTGYGKVCVGGTVTPVASTTPIATDYTGVVTITVDFP